MRETWEGLIGEGVIYVWLWEFQKSEMIKNITATVDNLSVSEQ